MARGASHPGQRGCPGQQNDEFSSFSSFFVIFCYFLAKITDFLPKICHFRGSGDPWTRIRPGSPLNPRLGAYGLGGWSKGSPGSRPWISPKNAVFSKNDVFRDFCVFSSKMTVFAENHSLRRSLSLRHLA